MENQRLTRETSRNFPHITPRIFTGRWSYSPANHSPDQNSPVFGPRKKIYAGRAGKMREDAVREGHDPVKKVDYPVIAGRYPVETGPYPAQILGSEPPFPT